MKTAIALILCFSLLLLGCEKDKDTPDNHFVARIVGFDMNCSTCIVSFPDDSLDAGNLLGSSPNNNYLTVNLDKGNFKIGQFIKLTVRKAEDTDLEPCITLYSSYNYKNIFVLGYEEYRDLKLNDTIQLAYKDCIHDADRQVYICLDSVISDSRCPTGVECVWAGEAIARFKIEKYNELPSFIDLIEGTRDTLISGYRFSFLKLLPYPQYGIQVKPEDYKARIVIKKQ